MMEIITNILIICIIIGVIYKPTRELTITILELISKLFMMVIKLIITNINKLVNSFSNKSNNK